MKSINEYEQTKFMLNVIREGNEIARQQGNEIPIPANQNDYKEIYNQNQGAVESMVKGRVAVRWIEDSLVYDPNTENVTLSGALVGNGNAMLNFVFNLQDGFSISADLIKVDENMKDALVGLYNAWDGWQKSMNGVNNNGSSPLSEIQKAVQQIQQNS